MNPEIVIINVALDYCKKGETEFAVNILIEWIKEYPASFVVESYLGFLYEELEKYDYAEFHYIRAIENNPDLTLPDVGLGNIYFNFKRFDLAEYHYKRAIEKNLDISTPDGGLGQIYLKLKRYDLAEYHFKRGIDKDSDDLELENGLARVYEAQKKYNLAEYHFKRVISKNPTLFTPQLGLGNVYYYSKRFDVSEYHYKLAIDTDPTSPYPENGIGNLYMALQKYELAETHYKLAIEKDPSFSFAQNGIGNLYYVLQKYELAETHYKLAIENDPSFSEPENGLGNIYFILEKFDVSEYHYKRSVDKNPNSIHPEIGLGNVYTALQKYDLAEIHFKRAVNKEPSDGLGYFSLARLYESQNKITLAELHLIKYLFLLKDDPGERISFVLSFLKKNYIDNIFTLNLVLAKMGVNAIPFDFHNLYEQSLSKSKHILAIIRYLGIQARKESEKIILFKLRALANHFMGNNPEAFKIYNDKLDKPPYTLTLEDQYYLLITAVKSIESDDEINSIQKNAIEEAENVFAKFVDGSIPVSELYYGGQIFFFCYETSNILKFLIEADKYFKKADQLVYLPAAYMRVLTLKNLGYIDELNKEIDRIRKYEYKVGADKGYINGFQKRAIDTKLDDFLTQFRHYAHFREIQEAIIEVHGYNIVAPELHEVFVLQNLEEIEAKVKKHTLDKTRDIVNQYFQNQVTIESWNEKLSEIRDNFEDLDTLGGLLTDSLEKLSFDNPDKIEIRIAKYIYEWTVLKDTKDTHRRREMYTMLIQYFAIKNNLSFISSWSLLSFMYYIEEKKAPKNSTLLILGSLFEGQSDFLKEYFGMIEKTWINTLVTLGSISISPVTIFVSLSIRFMLEYQRIFIDLKNTNQSPREEYLSFKKLFNENIIDNILINLDENNFDKEIKAQIEVLLKK